MRGVHGGTPQTLGVPPPPHDPVVHVPQSSTPPHPSPIGPQLAPDFWHVVSPWHLFGVVPESGVKTGLAS